MTDPWKPLGARRTLLFLVGSGRMVASWRRFGWELEIHKEGRWPNAISLWKDSE